MIHLQTAVSAPVTVSATEVHLWTRRLDRCSPTQVARAAELLSPDEQARAEQMRRPDIRRRWVSCRGTLRRLLGQYRGMPPARIRFRYGPYGKPELDAGPSDESLHFSLSHSQGLVVYAVAREPVGVDLECHRWLPVEDLAGRFLSPYEAAEIGRRTGATQMALFITCWTRKEAYLKAVGLGLSGSLTDFDTDLRPRAERVLVAHRGAGGEVNRWRLFSPSIEPGFSCSVVVGRGPLAIRVCGEVSSPEDQ